MRMDINFFCGDCLNLLPTIKENSVDLVVTSPPYNCGKNYGGKTDLLNVKDYWLFTHKWLGCCFRVLSHGGRLAVNLPWWMGKKPRLEVPFSFHRIATECGFLFLDKIVWAKGSTNNLHVSGGWGGGGSGWGTWLSPSGPSIRCASEPILVFAKGSRGRTRISGEGRGRCVRGDINKEEFLSWTVDVWHVPGGRHPVHPAVFPEEIPNRLIRLYTFPDETVLDPFSGVGTTGVVCKKVGRKFLGIELNQEYVNISLERLRKVEDEKRNSGSSLVFHNSNDSL